MQATHSAITHLFDLLGREEAQCDLLERTILEEREAIRRLAIERFATINDARTNVLRTLQFLEKERAALIDRLAEEWGIDGHAMSLSQLCARLDPPTAQGLERRHEQLAAKIRRLHREITLNAMAIAEFQRVLHGGLQAWQDGLGGEGLYSASGRGRTVDAMVVRRRG